MYTLRLLFALLAGSFTSTSSTETGPDTDVLSCYTDAANTALLKQDPEYSRKSDSLDYAWSAAVKDGRLENKSAVAPPYILPIVFHIVHKNGPENISDADVQRSVDYLNQALANTDYYDPTTGASTQIQVCLAQRTPDNQATNGIDRIVSPLTNLNTQDDLMLKDLSRWAPRDYVNVWVVKEVSGLGLGSGLAGYAYYPGAHGGRVDGIVMEARWLSRDEAAVGVLIHELGHYLGLRHTFDSGCQNDDCTRNGDRVCDTPPDQSTVAVPCGGSANSCTTDTDSGFAMDQDDMHINYMDYGYFRCYSAFTAGQRDRMHFFLDGIRRSLTESKGCLPPCPAVVAADYTGGEVTVNVGTPINFANTSVNGASFRWVRDASLLSTATNYSETFNTVGTYRLKLVANPADPMLCQSDSVEQVIQVVCPVVADFSFPATNYETGAIVTFTNNSTGGGSSTWSVNGTEVGTDTDLTYTFSAPGRYQVCLQERNGLCSEEHCRSLVVSAPFCAVDAAFNYNSVGFGVGGTLTFTNISSGGTTRTWTIDGTQVGMDRNLTWTFPDLGSFEVCLRESNGVCDREFCRMVEVPQEPCTGPDCPGNEGCTEGFTYLYGLQDGDLSEEVTAVLPDGDRFFLSLSDGNRIWVMAIREDGSILWQREVFPDGNVGLITEMMLDDEGQLAAIGRTSLNSDSGDHSFIVRVNADTGDLLWARSYPSEFVRPIFNRIFSQARTGNYTIIGYTESPNSAITVFDRDGLFLTIDKANGSIVTGPLRYQNNGVLRFNTAAYDRDNGRYYVLGNIDGGTTPGGLLNGTFLLTLDEVGSPLNNRLYNLQQVDSTFPVGIVKEEDELIFAITAESSSPASHTAFLMRSDLNGDLISTRMFPNLTGPPAEMLANTQGYTLVGEHLITTVPFQTEMIQLDRSGEVSWARAILDNYHRSSGQYRATPQMINTHNNQIVLAGSIQSLREGSIVKLDIFGVPVAGCLDMEPGEVFSEETDLRTSTLQFFAEPSEYFTTDFFTEPSGLVFNPESCARDCPTEEICNNQIDDDADGLIDCDDPDIENDCCCVALPVIDLGPDTTACPGYVLALAPESSFVTYTWSTGALMDSITVNESGEYWLTVTDSCGNLASDTLTLLLRPRPLLDLGPDTTLCSNAIIPLLAQDGFATYEWNDGTTEKDFTGYGEGDFWVVAIDSCGRVQTDTVNVKIDPATEINLGVDTLICPGDTLTFRLNGFSNYQWSESSFIDCTNCPEVRFAPTTDTLLLVAAEFGGGCFSSDSIRISILPVMGTRDSVYLCPGDSIVFGDTTLFTTGQYLDVMQSSQCEQTDTLDVFQLLDTLTLETFSICQGDSMLVFDRFERIAGTYQRDYSAANGCDSIHAIELIVDQPVVTAATISICAGDSSLIFGTFERTPGDYSRLFTATNQCDSTHLITLEINTLEVTAAQLQTDCGAAAGAGEVVFNQPAAAVSIRWPDGTDQARNNNLAAGVYAITVTTLAEGCTAIANLTIEQGRQLNLFATATPETCPGDNDGTIDITSDELNGLNFSLNGGPLLSTPRFTDLSPNDYTLLVSDSLGCDQEFLLTVDAAGEVLLDLPETITIVLGDSVTLRPQTNLPTGTFLISWGSTLGDTCSNCPTLTLRPSAGTTVVATLTNDNGCSATDQTVISVSEEDPFYVPNVFSPNGDGVNDLFRLFPGPGVERIMRFSVFDRWGGQVYQAEDLSPTDALAAWDGRSPNGQLPSIGVYVYLVEVRLSNGEVVRQAGDVMLMR
jgi:gliding motility-associated-like protein